MLHGVGGRNPMVLLAGGGAVVVLVVAMVRRSSGGSGSSSNTTVPNTYDSTLSDVEAQWENQFEQLQGEIAKLNPTPGSSSGTNNNPWHNLPWPYGHRNINPPATFFHTTAASPAPRTAQAIAASSVRNAQGTPVGTDAGGFHRAYTSSLTTGRR
jgi:hypothetical protein